MLKNYLKIAFRSFLRHKVFTVINVTGLAIGISAALVIYLIVQFDFAFDKSHRDGGRIYRVVSDFTFQGDKGYNGGVCGPLTEAVRTQVTGIENSTPVYELSGPDVFIPGKDNVPVRFKSQDGVVLVSPAYFSLFTYNWIAGTPTTALSQPNRVVLTATQAAKYFPKLAYGQMIGKVITYDTLKTTVAGIVDKFPGNSDLSFNDFISYGTAIDDANRSLKAELGLTQWENTSSNFQLFVKLAPGGSAPAVQKQLNSILRKNSPPKPTDKGSTHAFELQPLSDLHFNEKYGIFNSSVRVADRSVLYSLSGLAVFLLLLACINFVNLTTAQAAQRAKEIGIRKTMGSSRQQLIIQFLSETFSITVIAVIISVALTPLALKLFADFIPAGVKADFLQAGVLLFLVLLTLVVAFASGFYPAIMLSGYKPVTVLKNQSGPGTGQTRNAWLRKSLTVTQFVIAQFFIMATVLVSKQIYYALHKQLGFKTDAIVIVNTPWKNRDTSRNLVLLNQLRAIPQIEMVSLGGAPPSSGNINSTDITYKDGKKEVRTEVQLKYGDDSFVKLYHIKLLAGRGLQTGDSARAILINQTYARELGFRQPADALNITIPWSGKPVRVAGVVGDFYQRSVRTAIKPLAIVIPTKPYQQGTFHIALKPQTAGGNEWKTAIASIKSLWEKNYSDDEFAYDFYDANIARFYESERRTSTLLSWATGLSVFISCLGLLGLAIYTTSQRTKEIGVRKVLGASVTQIVALLSTEVALLILLAFVIVTPLAWYAMNRWMQNFADHTPVSWWIFGLSGTGMLLAAMVTSGFQTVRAAMANPVKSLRSE